MEDKELIWVSKKFATKFKEINGDAQKILALDEYMATVKEASKREFKASLESLEEDVAIYKGLMLKVKQSFEDAKNKQLEASYSLWEGFEKEIPNTTTKINRLLGLLNPVANKIKELNDLVKSINIWDVEKLIKTIETLTNLYGNNKDMVKFLMDNYKPKE